MHQPVETVRVVDGERIHRFQAVREHGDGGEDWIVVGFEDEGVTLADRGFDWSRVVPLSAFRDGPYEALTAGEVPVWGY